VASANRTAYAILGLLAQGPKTGYEIKQVVEKTISHFWKESYGHLYPTINRLIAEGLVTRGVAEPRRPRARPRYHITPDGREALAAWLVAPVEPEGTRNELALKLYFGQSVPTAVSRAHLEAHREHHRQLLATYAQELPKLERQVSAGEPDAVYALITLTLGIHISEARVAWCADALRRLDSLGPSDDGPSSPEPPAEDTLRG
jgi:PadR family transcriptional regulator AphA